MLIEPTSILMIAVIYGCAHHVFGNRCDEDAKCLQWLNMIECHERYYGDVHTDLYRRALAEGKNVKPRSK